MYSCFRFYRLLKTKLLNPPPSLSPSIRIKLSELDLGLDSQPKMSTEERSLQRLHHIQCLFFMGVKDNPDGTPSLVMPARSSEGALIHNAGSKTAQNAAYREGIDDTMLRIYSSSTNYLGRAADLNSNSYTDLQVSHTVLMSIA